MKNNTKYINTKDNSYFNMKKIFLLLSLILYSLISANALQQANIINYPFESASGTIIFDVSGNEYNSILMNGASFSSASSPPFGTYAMYCNGANHYAVSVSPFPTTINRTVSFWVRPNTGNTNKATFTNTLSANDYFEIYYDWSQNTLNYKYVNESSNGTNSQVKVIDNFVLPTTLFTHFVIEIDGSNGLLSYYKNSVPILINSPIAGGVHFNASELKTSYLCKNVGLNNTYYGRIDEYNMFNFLLNSSQVSQLYTTNALTLGLESSNQSQTQTYSFILNDNLINSTTPLNNQSVTKFENINIVVSTPATCELYIDNNLIYTTTQPIYSFTYPLTEIGLGHHNYFAYCHYINNNATYYGTTLITNFNIIAPIKSINFYVYNADKTLNTDSDLYLVTPCPKVYESSSHWIIDRPFYTQKLVNGYANFNLNYNAEYEFCLLKGRVNYEVDNYTQNINFASVGKITPLGTLYVTNDTLNYNLGLSNTDLYSPAQPEFWGKTWQTLFTFIMGLVIGGVLIALGIYSRIEKLVVIGGLIIMVGLGASIWTFVGFMF